MYERHFSYDQHLQIFNSFNFYTADKHPAELGAEAQWQNAIEC
jgi:hypothetical protein